MEFFVTTFKYIDFIIENLWIMIQMQPSIDVSHGPVHSGTTLLAKLTVKDYDSLLFHECFNFVLVLKEQFLNLFWFIDIHGAFDMASLIFIVESTINYDIRMVSFGD